MPFAIGEDNPPIGSAGLGDGVVAITRDERGDNCLLVKKTGSALYPLLLAKGIGLGFGDDTGVVRSYPLSETESEWRPFLFGVGMFRRCGVGGRLR